MQIVNEIDFGGVRFDSLNGSDPFVFGSEAFIKLDKSYGGKNAVNLTSGVPRSFNEDQMVIAAPTSVLTLKNT